MDHNLQSYPTTADKILQFLFFTIDDTSEEIDECGAVINSISFADSLLMCQKGINIVVSIFFFHALTKKNGDQNCVFYSANE
jgi:hypothetical protein